MGQNGRKTGQNKEIDMKMTKCAGFDINCARGDYREPVVKIYTNV